MQSRTIIRESCSKRGLVLTCYVDGRKKFKAAMLTDESPADAIAAANTEKRQSGASRRQ
jgi:hypothetical protein